MSQKKLLLEVDALLEDLGEDQAFDVEGVVVVGVGVKVG